MIHPQKINHSSVQFYTFANLHVYGRKTIGATVGIFNPKVLIDRSIEMQPGFEALCYHEGCHAYEYHRFTALLSLAPGLGGITWAVYSAVLWPVSLALVSILFWCWWAREQETRADAVALFGSGPKEFWALLLRVGPQRTWWGSWCYGKTLKSRERRAQKRCVRVGWDC